MSFDDDNPFILTPPKPKRIDTRTNRMRVDTRKNRKRIDTRTKRTRTDTRISREREDKRIRSRVGRKKDYDKTIEWIGIDGEGQGRATHLYIFLAASNENRTRTWSIENPNGLTSMQVLRFIMSLPSFHSRIFAYSFNYDLTKMLEDLPNNKLYDLFRPELRQRRGIEAVKGPKPVRWNYFSLNLQGTRFSVGRTGQKRRVIWDIWKFFQNKFVEALKDWKIGDPEVIKHMKYMKDHRHEFDKLPFEDVKAYCFDECAYMAMLARKLFESHLAAGLRLKNFYGAGSSASAMLEIMGIKDKIVPTIPEMRGAVASAYFGGRFENSVIGEITGELWSYDISSAYPYQTYFLPCLLHASWEYTTDRNAIENCRHALVHYKLPDSKSNTRIKSWGPFPFRERASTASDGHKISQGGICYPIVSGGGWVWRDEYLQGEKLFSNVQFVGAWLCHSTCDCHPFKDIAQYYLERLKIGKEGPGIVIKLGVNSCYGKIAQSVGRGQFNSWIWAGMITSGCRAQLLEMLSLHKKRENVLMMATDGIYTRERIITPIPKDTGTNIPVQTFDDKTNTYINVTKPLGGWEENKLEKGVFIARPGIYYPLNPTIDDIKNIKGRGVGRGVILENWDTIIDAWKKHGIHKIDADGNKEPNTVFVSNVSRFCGAKTSISRSGKPRHYSYNRSYALPGMDKPSYGQWITRKVEMSFNPMPKRSGVNPDGLTLTLRKLSEKEESLEYSKALITKEAIDLKLARLEAEEQPDNDLSDYQDME